MIEFGIYRLTRQQRDLGSCMGICKNCGEDVHRVIWVVHERGSPCFCSESCMVKSHGGGQYTLAHGLRLMG